MFFLFRRKTKTPTYLLPLENDLTEPHLAATATLFAYFFNSQSEEIRRRYFLDMSYRPLVKAAYTEAVGKRIAADLKSA
jgi:hypothetical protein